MVVALVQLPAGATQERTLEALKQVEHHFLVEEKDNVEAIFAVAGFSFAGAGQNAGLTFVKLRDWSQRPGKDNGVAAIGAARTAFFPSITLTGSLGTSSSQLPGLFEPGTRVWSLVPQVTLPLFTGGRNQATLDTARANQQIAATQYEKTVQTAFREVADALADQATLDQRVTAREALVAAAAESLRLSEARYRHGLDSHLALLDAQRTHYAARQALISVSQLRLANLLYLYKALGGGTRITGANRNAHESSGEGGHDQQH